MKRCFLLLLAMLLVLPVLRDGVDRAAALNDGRYVITYTL